MKTKYKMKDGQEYIVNLELINAMDLQTEMVVLSEGTPWIVEEIDYEEDEIYLRGIYDKSAVRSHNRSAHESWAVMSGIYE